ncbi:ABC transporter substrate-binding protein [Celerinatantimonas diazotrophica]|nr:ABC transporter substrate-binding protein [Celerinatantimonas diazotrophica]
MDNSGHPKPWLVKSYRQVSARRYQFNLNPGVSFSSGNPLNAQDVVWSFDKLRQHRAFAQLFSGIQSVKALSAERFEITLTHPYQGLLSQLAYWFVFDKRWLLGMGKGQKELVSGSGPYQISEDISGVRAVLKLKPHYWRKSHDEGNVTELEVVPILHEQTRYSALQGNDVDIIDHVSPSHIAALNASSNLAAVRMTDMAWLGIIFNQQHSWLTQKKAREALSVGINNAMLYSLVYAPLGQLSSQLVSEKFYDRLISKKNQFLKAYQLLQSVRSNDQPLRLTLVSRKDNRFDLAQTLAILKTMFARMDIDLKVKVLSSEDFDQSLAHCSANLYLVSIRPQPNDLSGFLKAMLSSYHGHVARLHCALDRHNLKSQFAHINTLSGHSQKSAYQAFLYHLSNQYAFKPLFWLDQIWAVNQKISLKVVRNRLGLIYFDELKINRSR